MKKYTNIPFKERQHNDKRCFNHEMKLEEIIQKKEIKAKEEHYKKDKTDNERQEVETFEQLLNLLKEIEETK